MCWGEGGIERKGVASFGSLFIHLFVYVLMCLEFGIILRFSACFLLMITNFLVLSLLYLFF